MASTASASADDSFGRRLRRERERRQISLVSIAENTKISASHFEDLERDDVSRWPSGIFRRSFIRAYAKAVGLDVDATMREFLERFPDPLEADPAVAAPHDTATPPADAPAPAVRVTVADTTAVSFAPGRVLPSARDRLIAIGCDLAVVLTLGLALYAVLGALWMPLCVVLVAYYGLGILLLGNTPGVCFNAPADRPADADRFVHREQSTAQL